MKGLFKNNFYAVCTNAKVFAAFMFLLGIFVVAVISQSAQIAYVMTGIIGFSVNAIAVAKNEFASKWGKYKLTLPVKRADIIKSMFLNQLIWLLIGTLFVGIGMSLSWLLHGCSFDQPIDAFTMFALGISISLFMGAIFFPLFYSGGEERSEVFMIISLLSAIGIDLVIINILNDILEPGPTTPLLGAITLLVSSLLIFTLSYPLTVAIFKQKEY